MEYPASLLRKKGREEILSDRETGTIKWFDASKCFGFITRDQGGDIFVSHSSFRDKDSCFLVIGSRVEFTAVDTAHGLRAQDLIVIN